MSDDELGRRKGRAAPPARYGRDTNDDEPEIRPRGGRDEPFRDRGLLGADLPSRSKFTKPNSGTFASREPPMMSTLRESDIKRIDEGPRPSRSGRSAHFEAISDEDDIPSSRESSLKSPKTHKPPDKLDGVGERTPRKSSQSPRSSATASGIDSLLKHADSLGAGRGSKVERSAERTRHDSDRERERERDSRGERDSRERGLGASGVRWGSDKELDRSAREAGTPRSRGVSFAKEPLKKPTLLLSDDSDDELPSRSLRDNERKPASKKLEFLDQLASRAGGRTGAGNGGDSPKAGGSRRGSGGALHESPHASAARSGREGTVHSSSATGSGQHSPKVAHTGSSKEPPSAFDTLLRLEQKEREAAHGAARDRDEKERRSSLGSPKAALAEREPPAGAARKEPPWKDRDVQYKFRERDFALERDAYKRHPKAKEKKKEEKKEKLKDSLEMSSDEERSKSGKLTPRGRGEKKAPGEKLEEQQEEEGEQQQQQADEVAAEAPAPPPTPQVKETVRAEGAVPPAAAAAAEEKPKQRSERQIADSAIETLSEQQRATELEQLGRQAYPQAAAAAPKRGRRSSPAATQQFSSTTATTTTSTPSAPAVGPTAAPATAPAAATAAGGAGGKPPMPPASVAMPPPRQTASSLARAVKAHRRAAAGSQQLSSTAQPLRASRSALGSTSLASTDKLAPSTSPDVNLTTAPARPQTALAALAQSIDREQQAKTGSRPASAGGPALATTSTLQRRSSAGGPAGGSSGGNWDYESDMLRDNAYQQWLQSKKASLLQVTRTRQQQDLALVEQHQREEAEKQTAARRAFESWKEKKEEQKKLDFERSRPEREKTRKAKADEEEQKEIAKKAFESWKEKKDADRKDKILDEKEKKETKEDEEREKEEKKKKEKEEELRKWEKKKEKRRKEEEEKRKREQKQKEKEEAERKRAESEAARKYEEWLNGTTKREKKRASEDDKLSEAVAERPPWAPTSTKVEWKVLI